MVVPRVLLLMVVGQSCLCLPSPQQRPQPQAQQVKRVGDYVEDQVDFIEDVAEDALKLANQVSGQEVGMGLYDQPSGGAPPPPPSIQASFGASFQTGSDPSPQEGLFDSVVDFVQDQGSQLSDTLLSSADSLGSSIRSQVDQVQDSASQFGDTVQSSLDAFGSSVQSQLNPAVDLVQDQGNQFIDTLQGAVDSLGKQASFSISSQAGPQGQETEFIGTLIKGGYDAISDLNFFPSSGNSPEEVSLAFPQDSIAVEGSHDQPRLGLSLVRTDGVRDIVTGGLKLVGLDKVFGPILQGISDVGETAGRLFGTTIDNVKKVAHQAGETTLEVVGGPYRTLVEAKKALGQLKVDSLRNTRTMVESLGEIAGDKLRNAGNLAMSASMDAASAALDVADAASKFANRAAKDTFYTATGIGQAKLDQVTGGLESVVKLGSTVGKALEDTVSSFLPTEEPFY